MQGLVYTHLLSLILYIIITIYLFLTPYITALTFVALVQWQ